MLTGRAIRSPLNLLPSRLQRPHVDQHRGALRGRARPGGARGGDGGAPAGCCLAGDSPWHLYSAVAAGITPFGVPPGAAVDRRALEGAGAAVVVESLLDIAAALGPA